jgi:hypothetical protein
MWPTGCATRQGQPIDVGRTKRHPGLLWRLIHFHHGVVPECARGMEKDPLVLLCDEIAENHLVLCGAVGV